jgi:hypothetical protein
MVIKYATNRKGAPRSLALGIAFILVVAFSSSNVHLSDPDIQGIITFFALIVLYGFFGIFIIADDTGVYKVDPFIFKRGLPYNEIQEVWYYQSYVTGGRPRILAIKGSHNGQDKVVKLGGNKFFSDLHRSAQSAIPIESSRNSSPGPRSRLGGTS